MGNSVIPASAKDQADGWIFIGVRPMLFGVIAVKVHLTGVGMGEFARLQVDNDQATKPAVK